MSEKDRAAERAAAVTGAMDDIAEIEAQGRQHGGMDQAGVECIKERLLRLAERDDLFSDEDFPPPDTPGSSVSYRIAQNDNDELALYVQCVGDGTWAPPHEHRTWAVIVGMRGQEFNRLYGPCVGGGEPQVQHEVVVERGTGVAMCSLMTCTRSGSRAQQPTSTAMAWPSNGSPVASSGTLQAASGVSTTMPAS